jgi:hypothetical protein
MGPLRVVAGDGETIRPTVRSIGSVLCRGEPLMRRLAVVHAGVCSSSCQLCGSAPEATSVGECVVGELGSVGWRRLVGGGTPRAGGQRRAARGLRASAGADQGSLRSGRKRPSSMKQLLSMACFASPTWSTSWWGPIRLRGCWAVQLGPVSWMGEVVGPHRRAGLATPRPVAAPADVLLVAAIHRHVGRNRHPRWSGWQDALVGGLWQPGHSPLADLGHALPDTDQLVVVEAAGDLGGGRRRPPKGGAYKDVAGFASCYGPLSRAPLTWLSTLRFDAKRFPPTPAACYRPS